MAEPEAISKGYPLNLPQRIQLLSILPLEGNVLTLRIARELREQLSLTEEEHAEFGVSVEQKGANVTYTWTNRPAAEAMKDFRFKPLAASMIADALKNLDEASKLTAELLPLYEIFVEGGSA